MRRTLLALALSAALPISAHSPGSRTLLDELKAAEDPTLLKRRAWLDAEWNSFRDSSSDLDLTPGVLWAWPLAASQDWAVRAKLPLRSHHAGDGTGDTDKHGIGDLKLAAGTAVRIDERWRAGGGLEMRFPTANDDSLGANVWRPMLFGTVAWDVTPTITFSPSIEYNKSVKEENGASPQRFAEFFFPLTFVLPGNWAVTPRYELKVDYANRNEITRSSKLSVSRTLEHSPLGFTLSVKKPMDTSDKKAQVNFVVTRFLR